MVWTLWFWFVVLVRAASAVRRIDSQSDLHLMMPDTPPCPPGLNNQSCPCLDDFLDLATRRTQLNGWYNGKKVWTHKDTEYFKGTGLWDAQLQRGDIIFLDDVFGGALMSSGIRMFTTTRFYHASVISEVPENDVQTLENVKVIGSDGRGVYNSSLLDEVGHGGVGFALRRVDKQKFPNYNPDAMIEWLKKQMGKPYDRIMALKGFRHALPSFIPRNPSCSSKLSAVKIFKKGGPSKFMCSQLATWALSFAGGVNDMSAPCLMPWSITDLQPYPKELIKMPIWQDDVAFALHCRSGKFELQSKYSPAVLQKAAEE